MAPRGWRCLLLGYFSPFAAGVMGNTHTRAPSTVYVHGEEGFPCIRIPTTLDIASSGGGGGGGGGGGIPLAAAGSDGGVLLSFAAARSWTGDSCFPTTTQFLGRKEYSAHVVKRSTDRGESWSQMREIGRTEAGAAPSFHNPSPEGCSLYHTASKTVLTIFTANVSNASTGLRLWQSNSGDAGQTWSRPAPLNIPQLRKSNVTEETHISPGNGIELRSGPHTGRLLNVLILISGNVLDVVIYSDDAGVTPYLFNCTSCKHCVSSAAHYISCRLLVADVEHPATTQR